MAQKKQSQDGLHSDLKAEKAKLRADLKANREAQAKANLEKKHPNFQAVASHPVSHAKHPRQKLHPHPQA